MSEFAARIGRIRMKNGGAEVRVLHCPKNDPDGQDWRGSIVTNARETASFSTEESPLVGYVVVGLFGDGSSSVGWRYDPDRCPVPKVMLPTWVAEVLRRDILTANEAEHVFHRMFEWVE